MKHFTPNRKYILSIETFMVQTWRELNVFSNSIFPILRFTVPSQDNSNAQPNLTY